MTDPAILTEYDETYATVCKALLGRNRDELLRIAIAARSPRTETEFAAFDALADLLREVGA